MCVAKLYTQYLAPAKVYNRHNSLLLLQLLGHKCNYGRMVFSNFPSSTVFIYYYGMPRKRYSIWISDERKLQGEVDTCLSRVNK